jgi:DNA-binding NarL/FixJ family response regulator
MHEPPVFGSPPKSLEELGLTGRQFEVLALMMQGKSNKAICRHLDMAEQTVKKHVTAVLKALNASDRGRRSRNKFQRRQRESGTGA